MTTATETPAVTTEDLGGGVNAVAGEGHPEGLTPVAPGVPASPPKLLLAITGTVEDLSRDVAEVLDQLHEIEALDVLAAVREARQSLSQIEAVVEARAARLMSSNKVEWPGGVAERRFGKDRKEWKNDDLAHQVVQLIAGELAASPEGEIDEMLAALIADAVAKYAETNRPTWRVTPLKAMGIDPDEFCHAIPGRTTIQITTAGPQ